MSIFGSPFMNGQDHHHLISWFSSECLEGAIISIGIGIAVYFLFVQNFLLERKGNSIKYLDLWPEKLNIENFLFRPVIGVILPFMGALFARVVDLLTAGPVRLLLSQAEKVKFIQPPEDTDFGYYQDEAKQETVGMLLPSSLAYGLMTFAVGLLFVIAFMML